MQNPLSFMTRILIQLLLMRPDVLTVIVTPWESSDDYLAEKLQLRKDFLEQLLRKS